MAYCKYLLILYYSLDNKHIYSEVRSEFLGLVTKQNKTALFLADTMQIDIQTKTFLQNTGTDRQYYSVMGKNTAIFTSAAYSVQMLAHICHI